MAAEHALGMCRAHFRQRPQDYQGAVLSRIYQCWRCGGLWHLTAFTEDKFRALEKLNERVEQAAVRRVIALVDGLDLD